jgi:hypothetical protein
MRSFLSTISGWPLPVSLPFRNRLSVLIGHKVKLIASTQTRTSCRLTEKPLHNDSSSSSWSGQAKGGIGMAHERYLRVISGLCDDSAQKKRYVPQFFV